MATVAFAFNTGLKAFTTLVFRPQSNDMAESAVKTMKSDYVASRPKHDLVPAARHLVVASAHSDQRYPHSALEHGSRRDFNRSTDSSIEV